MYAYTLYIYIILRHRPVHGIYIYIYTRMGRCDSTGVNLQRARTICEDLLISPVHQSWPVRRISSRGRRENLIRFNYFARKIILRDEKIRNERFQKLTQNYVQSSTIINEQHGFRLGRSTTTNRVIFKQHIPSSFSSPTQTDVMLKQY